MTRIIPGIIMLLVVLIIIGVMIALNPQFVASSSDSPSTTSEVAFASNSLSINTATNTHTLQVEIAKTTEQRAQGLMGRESLDNDKGMLFLFGHKRVVHMWMANMLIPLDMIFIDENHQVVHIADNIPADSEDTISSQLPVVAALEVNAGMASQLGLAVGDYINLTPFLHKEASTISSETLNTESLPKEMVQ